MQEEPLDSDIELTEEQEKVMLDFWNQTPNNPPSLIDIGQKIFGQILDGRSKEARAIKKSLSKHSLKPKRGSGYEPKVIELDENKKIYITNNASTMTAVEMARILFENPSLTNLNAESRIVNDFIKTLDTKVVMNASEVNDVPNGDYEPPKSLDKILRRVNSYINLNLDKEKLSPSHRKGLEALIGYLHTYRFTREINSYESNDDRKSCEDAFIRYTWNKPDLSQEEVDQYIILANEVVMAFKAKRRMEKLQRLLEEITGNDTENVKISMSLTEAIGKANTEFNACIKRQTDLFDDLTEKRSQKIKNQVKDNASILNLVELWKNEESRKELIELGKKEQEDLKDEVKRLMSLSELKCKILGMTVEEAVN